MGGINEQLSWQIALLKKTDQQQVLFYQSINRSKIYLVKQNKEKLENWRIKALVLNPLSIQKNTHGGRCGTFQLAILN
jgi:hypothetical protein